MKLRFEPTLPELRNWRGYDTWYIKGGTRIEQELNIITPWISIPTILKLIKQCGERKE